MLDRQEVRFYIDCMPKDVPVPGNDVLFFKNWDFIRNKPRDNTKEAQKIEYAFSPAFAHEVQHLGNY